MKAHFPYVLLLSFFGLTTSSLPLSTAHAQVIDRAAGATLTEIDCTGFTAWSDCFDPLNFLNLVTNGGHFATAAAVSDAGGFAFNTGDAFVWLDVDPFGFPLMGARAAVIDPGTGGAAVWGARLYTYVGADTTLEFGGNVTYTHTGGTTDSFGRCGREEIGTGCVTARVQIIDSAWDMSVPFPAIPTSLALNFIDPLLVLHSDTVGDPAPAPGPAQTIEAKVTFDVQDGDTFFIQAELRAQAFQGGFADSSSTFVPFIRSDDFTQAELLQILIPTTPLDVVIKPGDSSNNINVGKRGVIPVAVLTDGEFDATQVDAALLTFGPALAHITHQHGHFSDVDADGDLDLVVHFRNNETGIMCGDTDASLSGETFSGDPVFGSDVINTVGKTCN